MLAKVKVVIKANTVDKVDNIKLRWKKFATCLFAFCLFFASSECFSQITVIHFNAGWNEPNKVTWIKKLKDCDNISYVDIAKDVKSQNKYKVVVVPTIIIFKDGEEALRFQADLSFKMVATKEEVQEKIDELLMSDF